MRLWQFVVRRLLLLVPVFFGVSLITFALLNIGGNPCAPYTSERMNAQQLQEAIERSGCARPVTERYLNYMGGLFHGDLGTSGRSTIPVAEQLAAKFPATFELSLVAMTMAVAFALPLGILSATRKDTPVDHATRTLALSGISIPIFWLALLLQMLMLNLTVSGSPSLPISGRYSLSDIHFLNAHPVLTDPSMQPTGLLLLDTLIAGDFVAFLDVLSHIILPATALAYLTMAIITRMMRSSMLEVLRQDYVFAARAKGLNERQVIRRHARKNAMIPTVTVIGLSFGALLSGAVLTESVFQWPGLGRWSTDTILNSDSLSIMGFALVISVMYVVANLAVDVVYAFLDPRIRLE